MHWQGFRLSKYPKRPYGCKVLPYASQIRQTVSWSPPDRHRSSIQVRDTWKEKPRRNGLWQSVYDQLEGNEQTRNATRCSFYQYKGSKSSFFPGAETTAQRRIPRTHDLSSAILSIQRSICLVKQFEAILFPACFLLSY